MANNAVLYDEATIQAAGVDNLRKTRRGKIDSRPNKKNAKDVVKRMLRVNDLQNAVRRFNWVNLPDGLTGDLIERILYYRGQGMFFFMPQDDKFYFLPYTLAGTIDVYGRFTKVTPLPFNGSTPQIDDKKDKPWITGLTRNPMYSIKADTITIQDWENNCVLLSDYTKQLSQTVLPRQALNDPFMDIMSECIPFMRTALIKGTGISGVRVNDADQQKALIDSSLAVEDSALSGDIWVPIIGDLEFQPLADGTVSKAEEYLLAMQSLDNFRLGTMGLTNGGIFEKKAHITNAELQSNQSSVSMILQDSLKLRQDFCILVNSLWGLDIWCEISESVLGIDQNMDGVAYDTGDAPIDDNDYSDNQSTGGAEDV